MIRVSGTYEISTVAGEELRAFLPFPLPPRDPQLLWSEALTQRLVLAQSGLKELQLAGDMIPSLSWFVYAFVRKEAVLSAQIEGTQATLVDLFESESSKEAPINADVEEVCGYVDALGYAMQELSNPKGLPLSLRLLCNAHKLLLGGARGQYKMPGQIRKTQNWLGATQPRNAVFVPPPPHQLASMLSELEHFIHDSSDIPELARVGLLHVQFETLHPFLDGNGRLGRLLITLLLTHWGMLSKPTLYLSLYFKANRKEYYERLNAVRLQGDWEGWLSFFFDGVATVASQAVDTSRRLNAIVQESRKRLLDTEGVTVASVRLFEYLPSQPMVTPNRVMEMLECSRPSALKSIRILKAAGILQAHGTGKKNPVEAFGEYVKVLGEGTEI